MSIPNTMQAAVVRSPGELQIQKIPVPSPGRFDALVRIEVCGLCGTTDRHLIEGRQCHHPRDKYPAVLGHEAVGTVVTAGPGVRRFKLGDRVTRPVAIWPGTSFDGLHSAWGGFAEYGIVKDHLAAADSGERSLLNDYTAARQMVVPAHLDAVDASLAISLAEVASWMWKLGPLGGRSIGIGGTGFVAAAMCVFARLAGASEIVVFGRRQQRIEAMWQFGATAAVNITEPAIREAVLKVTSNAGLDYFAEATGVDRILTMGMGLLRTGGTAAIYGAPETYTYSIPMREVATDICIRPLCAEEHLAYRRVCDLIRCGAVNTTPFRSRIWKGLATLSDAVNATTNPGVIKQFVQM